MKDSLTGKTVLPGQRVTGRTLAQVWPRALAEVLRFGNTVGNTRELLNLVSVIENPKGGLEEIRNASGDAAIRAWAANPVRNADGEIMGGSIFGVTIISSERVDVDDDRRAREYEREIREHKHPILGISWADLDDYYTKSFMGLTPPEGVPYSYGSRLHGRDAQGKRYYDARDEYNVPGPHPDQLAAVRKLLRDAPGTRAAWLTPWRPDEDSGKESGRPCLVGAWFRAVEGKARLVQTTPLRVDGTSAWDSARLETTPDKLHLTVVLRSHDCYGAYPLNLAAVCRWLCEEAEVLNMEVGTLTCVSMSAHIYERDLEAAGKVVKAHVKPGTGSQDPRSAWRVWKGINYIPKRVTTDSCVCIAPGGKPFCYICGVDVGRDHTLTCKHTESISVYSAEASDPEGTRVLQLFEAPTKERLIRDIQASGLVTSVQHALWLGAEVGKL